MSRISHLIGCNIEYFILSSVCVLKKKIKNKVLYIGSVNPHCSICILYNLTTIDLAI